MKKRKDYLKPRLTGERFDGHSIPLEVLKDWAAFEDLIVETAKWLYKSGNPSRERVPRGFTRDFSLTLTAVEEGSAVPVLQMDYDEDLAGAVYADWFEKARDNVVAAIAAAANDDSFDQMLPPNFGQYFDRFGRSLRDGEAFQFRSGSADYDVTYTREVRKRIVLSQAQSYRTEERVRGVLSEVDAKAKTFMLHALSGERVTAAYLPEIGNTVIDSLKAYDQGGRVLVTGTTVRDGADRLLRLETVSRVDPLDPLDVAWRLDELANLSQGWMDGEGERLSAEGLRWLSAAWESMWTELPLPYLYPTLTGGVEAEWSAGASQASLSIDFDSKHGMWVSSNDPFDADGRDFDLSTEEGWRQLELAVSVLYNEGSDAR
ncbi:hypothetical protein WI38_11230 [Burkholderia ubonensis]|uniref:Uncharacterized protein n=1 Tax=Burkholderia ubonensis TaxID=101571 RepID=A0A102LFC5_9BURK|nr:hypothetical protein [Burkholderia ubonensis]KUZ65261.1 hypothetical protein WI35_02775 [Burkholderia ubonensis]KUZ84268.1 hypothetical protein WI39_29075 [Burkholderia ubonensis]KUZ92689.1 hypothetical protein WI38_11230 [Burkholderia ubonensis]